MRKIITFILIAVACNFFTSIAAANDNKCYEIKNSSDREACLGNAYGTDNKDAQNIIKNNCYVLSDWANKKGLQAVCSNGKSGCYSLNDSEAVYSCNSCNGSNKWARLYAVGYNMTCN